MQTATRSRAPRMPADARRQQIIDVAMRMFATRGYAQTATADIASEAGISEPTIYRHFANKQALYLAVLEHGKNELLEAWRDIEQSAPDPLSAIARISAWHQQQQRDRPELLAHRFRAFGDCDDPVVAQSVRDAYCEIMDFVRALNQRAVDAGQLPDALGAEVATLLFLALGALSDIAQQLGLTDRLGADKLALLPAALGLLPGMAPVRRDA